MEIRLKAGLFNPEFCFTVNFHQKENMTYQMRLQDLSVQEYEYKESCFRISFPFTYIIFHII